MPYFHHNGAQLYYEEHGQGQPVLFLHGMWMSSRFFHKQLAYFSQRYRTITLDLRAHGRSSHVHSGHTVANYTHDVHAFVQHIGLTDLVMIGWSMGAFIIWDYVSEFGPENLKATVVVDQSASDFKWPDWPLGVFDFATLCQLMARVQTERAALVKGFIPELFKNPPADEEAEWVFEEITRLPESIAGAIFFDQSVQDYRPKLPKVSVPTLLCFGGDEKLVPVAAGEHLQQNLPHARLVVFEESSHCPFLEEPDRFNREVDQFMRSLG
jgi:non-heme chloroperoxidase